MNTDLLRATKKSCLLKLVQVKIYTSNEHDTDPTYKYPYNLDLEFECVDVEELLEQ